MSRANERRREERLRLGSAAVLTPSSVAELLPFRDGAVSAWLRAKNLVVTIDGLGPVVIWGDVLEAIRGGRGGGWGGGWGGAGPADPAEPPASRSRVPPGLERAGLVGRR